MATIFAVCCMLTALAVPKAVKMTEKMLINDRCGKGMNLTLTALKAGKAKITFKLYEDSTKAVLYDTQVLTVNVTDGTAAPGDANSDGLVTDVDSILLSRYLADWTVTIDLDACDVNNDGKVTDVDDILIARYLAGWTVMLQ